MGSWDGECADRTIAVETSHPVTIGFVQTRYVHVGNLSAAFLFDIDAARTVVDDCSAFDTVCGVGLE